MFVSWAPCKGTVLIGDILVHIRVFPLVFPRGYFMYKYTKNFKDRHKVEKSPFWSLEISNDVVFGEK